MTFVCRVLPTADTSSMRESALFHLKISVYRYSSTWRKVIGDHVTIEAWDLESNYVQHSVDLTCAASRDKVCRSPSAKTWTLAGAWTQCCNPQYCEPKYESVGKSSELSCVLFFLFCCDHWDGTTLCPYRQAHLWHLLTISMVHLQGQRGSGTTLRSVQQPSSTSAEVTEAAGGPWQERDGVLGISGSSPSS